MRNGEATVKKTFSKFKGVLLLTLGLALFPNLAAGSMMQPKGYPWPWPWAIGCGIRWSDLAGSHSIANAALPGDSYSFNLYPKVVRTKKGTYTAYRVYIRRTDNSGRVIADGEVKSVAEYKRTFAATMQNYLTGRSYVIQVQMGNYETEQPQKQCPPDRVKTVITIDPNTPAATNFFMDTAQSSQ